MDTLIYSILLVIVATLSTPFAYPHNSYRNKRDFLNEDDKWLRELELQIFNSHELIESFSPLPDPKLVADPKEILSDRNKSESETFEDDYDNRAPIVEPIVVTGKPYVLGGISGETSEPVMKEKEFSEPFTEVIDEHERAISTIEPKTDLEGGNHDKIVNDVTQSLSQWKTSIFKLYSTTDPLFPSSTNSPISSKDENWKNPVLDQILVEKPITFRPNQFFKPNRSEINDGSASEVKSFVVLIKNQTVFIILGCILSSVVIIALVIFGYEILKRLNERSTVTLVAHYEHDIYGQLIPCHSEKRMA